MIMVVFSIFILIVGLFSLHRIIVGLILSNFHQIITNSNKKTEYKPKVSVIIPAFNEEVTIKNSVLSVLNQTYQNIQLIVVNDGSNDNTRNILTEIKRKLSNPSNLTVVNQRNQGKSEALNNGIINFAQGELITVLDADSVLDVNAVKNMVRHFANPKVIAMADNVRIQGVSNFIDLVQRIEYLLGYRLKGSEQILKMEYIIGGVGSTFRKWVIRDVGYYDRDTVTEDIDMTLKITRHFGNRNWIIGYANDVISYTPAVHHIKELIKQRYRWKLGRFQSLYKHKDLFFNFNLNKFTLTLSWWKLPKIFMEEFFNLLNPIFVGWIIVVITQYNSFWTLFLLIMDYFIYAFITFLTESMPRGKRFTLILLSPFAYFFLFIINIVDFICLMFCLVNIRAVLGEKIKNNKWEHVTR